MVVFQREQELLESQGKALAKVQCTLYMYCSIRNKVYTVKLIYKGHPRESGPTKYDPDTQVVFIHVRILGSMESIHLGPVKCGLYKQVVFIYRWSLEKI